VARFHLRMPGTAGARSGGINKCIERDGEVERANERERERERVGGGEFPQEDAGHCEGRKQKGEKIDLSSMFYDETQTNSSRRVKHRNSRQKRTGSVVASFHERMLGTAGK